MSSSFSLRLKKFDIKTIPADSVVLFIGKRNTGKSFLVRDLLYYHQDVPVGTVISGTESANMSYGKMVPPLFVHDEYTAELLEKVIKRQKIIVSKMNKDVEYRNVDPRAFLVLDDCLYDNKWVRDVNIRSCFMNGRHFKLFFLITMQYALGIPPNLRTNVDYVFILRENIFANRKRIYEQYAGMFPTFDIFNQVMDSCTENFECIVIHNGAKSNKLEDQVFWYKAADHQDFRLCLDSFWEKNDNEYDPGFDQEEVSLADGYSKKRNIHINVHKDY